MPYWQNVQVHAPLYFAPPETTSQFLSFTGTGLHAKLMGPRSDQVALARVNKRKINKENSRTVILKYVAAYVLLDSSMLQLRFVLLQENSRTVILKHVAAYVSTSIESPSSTLQLLLPQHPCNVTQITPPS